MHTARLELALVAILLCNSHHSNIHIILATLTKLSMESVANSFASNISHSSCMRFLHDMDKYSHQVGLRHHGYAFYPNFDIVELPNSFKLSGELPGVRKQDITIQFTSPQTIHIHGVTDEYHAHNPNHSNNSTNNTEVTQQQDTSTTHHTLSSIAQDKPTSSHILQGATPWSLERSTGQFSRTFSFPIATQESGSRATLKDGILTIQILKAGGHGIERHFLPIQ